MKEFIRPTTDQATFDDTVEDVRKFMDGCSLSVSIHEILGVLHKEMKEFEDAIHGNDVDKIRAELLDVATTAIRGLATIFNNTIEDVKS